MGEKKNKEILQEPTPLKKWTRMHSIEHATTQNTLATAYLSEHHSNCLATPVIVYIFFINRFSNASLGVIYIYMKKLTQM